MTEEAQALSIRTGMLFPEEARSWLQGTAPECLQLLGTPPGIR